MPVQHRRFRPVRRWCSISREMCYNQVGQTLEDFVSEGTNLLDDEEGTEGKGKKFSG